MKMFPPASTATSLGERNEALIAGPPSPLKPQRPSPAMVVMVPPATLRTRLLPDSEIRRLPSVSMAIPNGVLRDAFKAGPPSPEDAALPSPVTVVRTPAGVRFVIL